MNGTRLLLQSALITAGYAAQIRAGASATGPFSPDSASQQVGSRTTFTLNGKSARYYLLWITSLPSSGSAHVNEVKGAS